ncbi:hypothetical protein [Plantibacter cousiniae (nom. nud.)]|uniref:Immunity protein Imm1 n=1 Tax=Plantibacter cousiniae (nom. nud.) TaxID=199709 RepID=A0ABY1LH82_9MICO|nr:hypothetical protein [Plantibacter cousiniae]SKC40389.1 hypothetical protein SAMN06295973_0604 [Plantibacter cousiniae]
MNLSPEQYVERCLSDAEAEISRHLAAVGTDPDEARRAIDGALGSIYKAHNALFKLPGYWEQAESSVDGRTMQAVIYLRGRTVHAPIEPHEPEHLFPSSTTFPSDDLYPGVNYFWLVWGEMESDMEPNDPRRDKREYVRRHVAGRLVVQSLRRSVSYLRSYANDHT